MFGVHLFHPWTLASLVSVPLGKGDSETRENRAGGRNGSAAISGETQ